MKTSNMIALMCAMAVMSASMTGCSTGSASSSGSTVSAGESGDASSDGAISSEVSSETSSDGTVSSEESAETSYDNAVSSEESAETSSDKEESAEEETSSVTARVISVENGTVTAKTGVITSLESAGGEGENDPENTDISASENAEDVSGFEPDGGTVTFTVSEETTVTVDGTQGSSADITVGAVVEATLDGDNNAISVTVRGANEVSETSAEASTVGEE